MATNDGVAETHAFGEHPGESGEMDGQMDELSQVPEPLDSLPCPVPRDSRASGNPLVCWKRRKLNIFHTSAN